MDIYYFLLSEEANLLRGDRRTQLNHFRSKALHLSFSAKHDVLLLKDHYQKLSDKFH